MTDKPQRILLVEDEQSHARLIERSLRNAGLDVQLTVADTLRGARAQLQRERPDLLMLDVRLPDGEGTQLLEGDVNPEELPVVVLTGYGDEQTAVRAMKAGALDYIVKSAESLNSAGLAVQRAMREWALIVARRRAEAQKVQLQSQLAHFQRVASMGEMAATLTHEVNQPLAAIANYAGSGVAMLEQEHLDRQQLRAVLEKIEAQAQAAGQIIRRLRSFVARTTPRRTTTDIRQLVDDVVQLLAHEADRLHAHIELRFEEDLPLAVVDRIQIQQVLLNLIRNALEAVRDVSPDRRRIEVAASRQKNQILVAVRDWGPGFSPEQQQFVFESYFTTKAEGLGMGLSISRTIVENHGGRIWIESNPDGGAAVLFTLPAETHA